jgi:cell division protease FtsH
MIEADLMAELAILLAGRTAEVLLLGAPSVGAGGGSASDLARATVLARRIDQAFGMGAEGLVWSPVDPAAPIPPALAAAIRARLEAAEALAQTTLEAHRPAFLALAEVLRNEGHLAGDRLTALLGAVGPAVPRQGSVRRMEVPVAAGKEASGEHGERVTTTIP